MKQSNSLSGIVVGGSFTIGTELNREQNTVDYQILALNIKTDLKSKRKIRVHFENIVDGDIPLILSRVGKNIDLDKLKVLREDGDGPITFIADMKEVIIVGEEGTVKKERKTKKRAPKKVQQHSSTEEKESGEEQSTQTG